MQPTYTESSVFSDGQIAQWRIWVHKKLEDPRNMLEWLKEQPPGTVGSAWHCHDSVTANYLNAHRHLTPYGMELPKSLQVGENHVSMVWEINELQSEGKPVSASRDGGNWLYLTGSGERMLPQPSWVKQLEHRLDRFYANSEADKSCTCGGADCRLRHEVDFPIDRLVAIAELEAIIGTRLRTLPTYRKGWDGLYMLVNADTDRAVSDRSKYEGYTLIGGTAPHKPSSTGKMLVIDGRGHTSELYPQVCGLKWLKVREL